MNDPQKTDAALSVRGLRCTLGGAEILRGLSFEVHSGEILGILGPNGAGKSTLLRCLASLIASQGTIVLGGRLLGSHSPRQAARALALMHQNTGLPYPFPASEVVMMGRYPHQGRFRPESAQDRAAVQRVMEFTATSALATRSFNTLSGGERQRILFAKVLAQETPLILLDEPSASLDLRHQEEIFQLAADLAAGGRTFVAAVHDLRLAVRYCTRVLVLSRGQILADGPPSEVLTSTVLEAAYGVRARVYRNAVTGQWDFHLRRQETFTDRPRIHVIGGGGSGSGVLRDLADRDYPVTCGVLSPGDSDFQVAGAYGIPMVTSPPFSPIDNQAFDENCRLVSGADVTVLTNLLVGEQNLRNLEAAAAARTLVVLEDDDPAGRDFTGGRGLDLYRSLRLRATVLRTEELVTWLEDWAG